MRGEEKTNNITDTDKHTFSSRLMPALLIILSLSVLYLISRYSYPLFHSLVEIFTISIAGAVFMLIWNSRRFLSNNYLLFLGISFLFIGGVDVFHALAYTGMGIFPEDSANLAAQTWLFHRYIQSLAFLVAPLLIGRRLRLGLVFLGFAIVTFLGLISIFYWRNFPICYVEGEGLTPFKTVSEYVISALLVTSVFLLRWKRGHFDSGVFRLLVAAIAVITISELLFTPCARINIQSI